MTNFRVGIKATLYGELMEGGLGWKVSLVGTGQQISKASCVLKERSRGGS